MAIEIVDFPIKNGDFPVRYVSLPEGNSSTIPNVAMAGNHPQGFWPWAAWKTWHHLEPSNDVSVADSG
jgi:hypothetical protein